MCNVDSGSVKPRQSHRTVWCTCFFVSMTFINIYRLRFGDFLSIHVDKLPLYLCSFCWYFHKIAWWFYFNEISNCCFCQPPRLFQPHLPFIRPPLIFLTREYQFTNAWLDLNSMVCHWFTFNPPSWTEEKWVSVGSTDIFKVFPSCMTLIKDLPYTFQCLLNFPRGRFNSCF